MLRAWEIISSNEEQTCGYYYAQFIGSQMDHHQWGDSLNAKTKFSLLSSHGSNSFHLGVSGSPLQLPGGGGAKGKDHKDESLKMKASMVT